MVSASVDEMPAFSIDAYRTILQRLHGAGFATVPVSAMADSRPRSAYIRHDIDFFLEPALAMARCEADLGVVATYFVLLSGPYNPRSPASHEILHELGALGHEIGLHYDLATYPNHPTEARAQLERDVARLGDLSGQAITSISMHQPGLADIDLFLSTDRWTHPHDPRLQDDLLYVSDSCRSWRDTTLLDCFGASPPSRLLLLTHPELYLDGTVTDRFDYLERVLVPRAMSPVLDYFDGEVRGLWEKSDAARLHDDRVKAIESAADDGFSPR